VKTALLVGFGLILTIWLLAGYYFVRRMADLETRAAAINARYTRAQDLLTTVRNQVLLGSVYVRDALLDPNAANAGEYRHQLEDAYRAADEALQQYEPIIDVTVEAERIGGLRRDIEDFRRTLLDVLATDSRNWTDEAPALLRQRIMPKRQGVLRVSEEVQTLNRNAFVEQQNAIVGVYRVTQRRLWESFGLAVVASLGIALLAMTYVSRLERRIQRQRNSEIAASRTLQRLSTQLLTAQEDERRTIARELHDEIGQVLTAIKVEISFAERAVDAAGGPPHLLEEVRALTDGALHSVRDLSHLLHPSLLDDLGLPAAIEWYARGFARRYPIAVTVRHDGMQERLVPETESSIYRIVQEALTNVAKHSGARTCAVDLRRTGAWLTVTVADDGVGIEPDSSEPSSRDRGLGLIGIRERVVALGGTLDVDSTPRAGTRVSVRVPARAAGARAPGMDALDA